MKEIIEGYSMRSTIIRWSSVGSPRKGELRAVPGPCAMMQDRSILAQLLRTVGDIAFLILTAPSYLHMGFGERPIRADRQVNCREQIWDGVLHRNTKL